MNPLDIELAERAKRGFYPVTVSEMNDRLNAIGYELNRERDCYSNNRWMTGPRAGQSYPAINTGVREMDTKLLSFATPMLGATIISRRFKN